MIRYRLTWTGISGAPYLSTFYAGGDGSGGDEANFRARLVTFLQAADTQLTNALAWTLDPEVDVMTDAGVVTGTITGSTATGSGGTAGTHLPHANQVLLQLRTGVFFGGREVRGRIFIPGSVQANSDSVGNPTAAARTTIDNAAAALIAGTGPAPVVWSRTNAASEPWTSATCATYYAVLRSRRD